MSGQDSSGQDLSDENLKDANLYGANVSGADLRNTVLQGANLENAYLTQADPFLTVLAFANLQGANLSYTTLFESVLIYADLSGADLSGAVLVDVEMSFVILNGTNLCGADLSRTTHLRRARLPGAICDDSTLWPDGFDPAERGAVKSAQALSRAPKDLANSRTFVIIEHVIDLSTDEEGAGASETRSFLGTDAHGPIQLRRYAIQARSFPIGRQSLGTGYPLAVL